MFRIFLIGLAALGAALWLPAYLESNPQILDTVSEEDEAQSEIEVPLVRLESGSNSSAQSLSGRKFNIALDETGHFIAEFRLNGRRVVAMVDTGATMVAINRSTARSIGLTLGASDFKYSVNTANGETMAAAARISELEIGRIRIQDVETIVLNDESLDVVLVGMSFLKRLKEFRVENGKLFMEQ